ncbi:MAG: hypothetical protein NTV98_04225 [Candidatus Roizmanbacteria bacterium]|nr:hypothetical protein [Candidatus Roizmanbacteria bacterium]
MVFVSAYSPKKGYFVTIFEDITVRKLAENNLQKKFEELEKMNQLMIGRELKMVELKKQVESLRK